MVTGQSSNQQFLVINTGDETLTGTAQVSAGAVRLPSPAQSVHRERWADRARHRGFQSSSRRSVYRLGRVRQQRRGLDQCRDRFRRHRADREFHRDPTNGAAALLVNFTDASTGTVTGWAWVFGDGGTSILASPGYSYATAGTFSVSLTVFGPLGRTPCRWRIILR